MKEINNISSKIINSGIIVHKHLGPGLLEKIYQECLAYELENIGLKVEREIIIPFIYKNKKFNNGFRIDLLVEQSIIVEIKAVEHLNPVYKYQLLTYLKLSKLKLGLLLNFNVPLFKNGIYRLIK